ncbi:hypothetical protein VTI74DRAFT_10546 [Chaetomium olivicolor]
MINGQMDDLRQVLLRHERFSWQDYRPQSPADKLLLLRVMGSKWFKNCLQHEAGSLDIAELLLHHDASIVDRNDDNGRTALYLASSQGNIIMVSKLILADADVTARSNDGSMPRHLAAQHGVIKVTRLLLDKDASNDSRDNNNQTPETTARRNGHSNIVQLLRTYPDPDQVVSTKTAQPNESQRTLSEMFRRFAWPSIYGNCRVRRMSMFEILPARSRNVRKICQTTIGTTIGMFPGAIKEETELLTRVDDDIGEIAMIKRLLQDQDDVCVLMRANVHHV